MGEEIADLLGVPAKEVAKAVQWVAVLIGIIAFLVFFALSPLHALILSGLLLVLFSMVFKAEKEIQRLALYIGVALMIGGVLGIFVPGVMAEMLNLARQLRQLLLAA